MPSGERLSVEWEYVHEVIGDPVGTTGHGLEFNTVQVDVVRQAKLNHVTCHTQDTHTHD